MFDMGLRLRQLREQQNLSQEQLGRRVERSKSVISSYENNIKIPPLGILIQFAVIFNVSLDYLVGIDKNEMLSVQGLSEQRKELLQTILLEFKENKGIQQNGLDERQQQIIGGLVREFTKK